MSRQRLKVRGNDDRLLEITQEEPECPVVFAVHDYRGKVTDTAIHVDELDRIIEALERIRERSR